MVSVNAIKFLDKYIGSLLCLFLSINKLFKHKKTNRYNKILIIQLWGIGETILTLPAIKALRDKLKKSNRDILVTERNKEVYYKNKNINNVKVLKLNPISIKLFILRNYKKYDLVIDMEEYLNISSIIAFYTGKERIGYSHGIRSNLYTERVNYNDRQHTAETFLDLVRALNIGYNLKSLEKLNYSKKDKNSVDKFLKDKKITKKDFVVGIAPGAAESARARMWPQENYIELCNNILTNKKNKIIFIGNKDEGELIGKIQKNIKEKNRTINTAGLCSLNALFYLIEKCNLFIGNDAGPMHIAAAQGVKTIGLFGPNLPVRFAPYGKNNKSIYKGNNCQFSPCINVHKGQVPDCLYPKNSKDYQKCMKNIKVIDVLQSIK
jgi:heptosyltransferase-2